MGNLVHWARGEGDHATKLPPASSRSPPQRRPRFRLLLPPIPSRFQTGQYLTLPEESVVRFG